MKRHALTSIAILLVTACVSALCTAGCGTPPAASPHDGAPVAAACVSNAILAAESAALCAGIAARATGNARAIAERADMELLRLTASGAEEETVAEALAAVRESEKALAAAEKSGKQVESLALEIRGILAEVKRTAEKAGAAGGGKGAARWLGRCARLAETAEKKAARARGISEGMKKRWLALSADPGLSAALTNRMDAADSGGK